MKINSKPLIYYYLGIIIILIAWGSPSTYNNTSPNTNIIHNVTVTAYCPCKKCNGKYYGWLATGHRMSEWEHCNIIAVDPKVIPLWSIVKYNDKYYLALDTGSSIKGNRIDVLLKTHKEAKKFGIKHKQIVEVYDEINIRVRTTGGSYRIPACSKRS